MAADKVLGFTIEIRGTDEEREKLGQLSRGIIDTTSQIKKLKDATDGNAGAQKASADKMAQLELQLKTLKGEYNDTQKSILNTQKANQTVAGSYNDLVTKNKELSASLRNMPDAFNPANEAVKEMQKELFDNTEKLKEFDLAINRSFRNVGNYPEAVNLATASMSELKAMVKQYTDEAAKAGEGTQEMVAAIVKAGEAKARIKDLKEEVAALDPDKKAAAFLRLGASVVGAFGAMQGAAALFGGESENLNKVLVKIQATQAILAGIQSIADGADEAAKVRIILLEKLVNAEKEKGIVVTEGATIAQRLWNVAVAANPWVAFMIVMASVLIAITAYINSTGDAAAAERERSKAVDGTVIKNKELRDSYNELLKQQNEYANALKVANGLQTDLDAKLNNISYDKVAALTAAQQEYNAALLEAGVTQDEQDRLIRDQGTIKINSAGTNFTDKTGYADALERQTKLDDAKKEAEIQSQKEAEKAKADLDIQQIEARKERLKTLGKTELQIKIDTITKQRDADLLNSKFTEFEKIQIEKDAQKQIQDLYDKQAEEAKKKQAEITAKWKEEADKRLQIIKDNNKKIQDLSYEIQEHNIGLYESGTQKELDLVALKYQKERDTLIQGKTVIFSKDKEIKLQQEKINAEIDERITQNYREENKARLDITIQSQEDIIKAKINLYDAEEQISILQIQRSVKTEQEKHKAILQVQIDADKKKLALLESSGNAEDIETRLQIEKLKTEISGLTAEYDKPENTVLAKALGVTDAQAKLIEEKVFELMKKSSDAIFNAEKERIDRISQYKVDALTNDHDTAVRIYQTQLDQNQISQAQFNQQKQTLDRAFEKAKQDEEEKAFIKKKRLALAQVGVDLAQALLKIQVESLASPQSIATGGIAGIAQATLLSLLATADAAVQAGIIASQKFGDGGLIGGKSHSQGGTMIEAEAGESIINARSTKMYAPLLSEINAAGGGRRFANGGIPLPVSRSSIALSGNMTGISREEVGEMILLGLNNIKVAVVDRDISDKLKEADVIESNRSY